MTNEVAQEKFRANPKIETVAWNILRDRLTAAVNEEQPEIAPSQLAMNAIAARSGLITKRQWLARAPQTVAQLAHSGRVICDLPIVFDRPRTPALRHRDRNPLFVNVQANKML